MSEELFQQEAELATLSILLHNPQKVDELPVLRGYMFSSLPNKVIFDTIVELLNQNLTPEIGLLESFLKANGNLSKVGGREYLNLLYSGNYPEENAREFADIISKSYKARTLLSEISAVPAFMKSVSNVDMAIDKLKSLISNLEDNTSSSDVATFQSCLKESWESILFRSNNPGIPGKPTGLRTLDLSTFGMMDGQVWTIAGRPGMGKSFVMMSTALHQASTGIPVLLFSLEMGKLQLLDRMLASFTGLKISDIKLGLLDKKQLEFVSETIKKVKDIPLFINDKFSSNVQYVYSTITKYVKQHGVKVVYIDYIQLLARRGNDATAELAEITRTLKILAQDLSITIVIASQFNRNLESRDDKRPILADVKQSGSIEEDSDIVLGLYREVMYKRDTDKKDDLEIIVLKHRDGETGGVMVANFDASTGRITERYGNKSEG